MESCLDILYLADPDEPQLKHRPVPRADVLQKGDFHRPPRTPTALLQMTCRRNTGVSTIPSSVWCAGSFLDCHASFRIDYGGYPDLRNAWFGPKASLSSVWRFALVPTLDVSFSRLKVAQRFASIQRDKFAASATPTSQGYCAT